MKYYFVGMHNKPNTKPLCSNTKTGKIIDKIIIKLNAQSIKTNLCNTDYLPIELLEIIEEQIMWHHRNKPKKNDTIVLLGKWVGENFLKKYGNQTYKTVSLAHPASIFKNQEKYIHDSVLSILKTSKP